MNSSLRQTFGVLRRRWWIIVVVMLLSGGATYLVSSSQTPVYSAGSTFVVNPGFTVNESDYNTMLASERLAVTYERLVNTLPMRERVARSLGIAPIDPDAITTSVVEESQLVDITIFSTDAELAADIANAFVTELQTYIREQSSSRTQTTQDLFNAQISDLEERREQIDGRIETLESAPFNSDASIQRQISDLQQERLEIVQSLSDLEMSAFLVDTETITTGVQIQMADPAVASSEPASPKTTRSVMLALFASSILGLALVALAEILDDTVKPITSLQTMTGSPLLASIPDHPGLTLDGRTLFTLSDPDSATAEAVRRLRTSLEFASASSPVRSITISSAFPDEGKSTIAANLGVVLAQSGITTAIVDADLRKPIQHVIFGVGNTLGLSTLLSRPSGHWKDHARQCAVPGLYVIPSGPILSNSPDLRSSDRLKCILEEIRDDVNMLIVDSPPLLSASEALDLSRFTDGVILSCRSGKTKMGPISQCVSLIRQGQIRLIGIVLNRERVGRRIDDTTYYPRPDIQVMDRHGS